MSQDFFAEMEDNKQLGLGSCCVLHDETSSDVHSCVMNRPHISQKLIHKCVSIAWCCIALYIDLDALTCQLPPFKQSDMKALSVVYDLGCCFHMCISCFGAVGIKR